MLKSWLFFLLYNYISYAYVNCYTKIQENLIPLREFFVFTHMGQSNLFEGEWGEHNKNAVSFFNIFLKFSTKCLGPE